jgi:hypothetical protein
MSAWTTAGLQPTTTYYSPYDPTLAAYGYVILTNLSKTTVFISLCMFVTSTAKKKLQIRENGLLSIKGVDNGKITSYHVMVCNFCTL